MPYTTDWDPNGIRWTFRGHVSAEEIMAANGEFYSDIRSDTARYQIIDAREVTSVEWNPTEIAKMAGFDKGAESTVKDIRVAYLTRDPEIREKLEKYVEISRRLESSWEFQGFEDLDAAREWASSGAPAR